MTNGMTEGMLEQRDGYHIYLSLIHNYCCYYSSSLVFHDYNPTLKESRPQERFHPANPHPQHCCFVQISWFFISLPKWSHIPALQKASHPHHRHPSPRTWRMHPRWQFLMCMWLPFCSTCLWVLYPTSHLKAYFFNIDKCLFTHKVGETIKLCCHFYENGTEKCSCGEMDTANKPQFALVIFTSYYMTSILLKIIWLWI